MNTLVSVVLSALQDTRDGGYTIEERAEAIAAAVRAETPESGALGQWIASLRVGDTLTVDDIHRFVRVELALRNADKHHQQARAMTAERDEWRDAAKWAEGQHQYWKHLHDVSQRRLKDEREKYALLRQSYERMGADLTVLRARLAACERVVEAAKTVIADADTAFFHSDNVERLRAAVAAETQGEKDA